jgi:hypothetical protein
MKTAKKQIITSIIVRENIIKLPKELVDNPAFNEADVSINEDVVTFKLPSNRVAGSDVILTIWQYVHHNEMWAHTKFVR